MGGERAGGADGEPAIYCSLRQQQNQVLDYRPVLGNYNRHLISQQS